MNEKIMDNKKRKEDSEEERQEKDIETGLKNVLLDGLTTRAMITLTEGIFLVGFALKLNAPLFVIGLLAALPPLAQLIQLPSIYIVEKYRNRKKISAYFSFASRFCLILIALIPFLFSPAIGLTLLIAFTFLRGALGAVGSTAWNSWMRDLIPQDRLGSFFSKRWSYSIALSIPLSLLAGAFIGWWDGAYTGTASMYGYSILFTLGFGIGIIGLLFLFKTYEPPMYQSEAKSNLLKSISKPFKNENFKKLALFLGSWNFAIFLAMPFFTVYILQTLNYSMTVVIALTVLTQIVNIFFFQIWGKFSDLYSNKSVLGVCGPLFFVSVLMWGFTTMPEKYALTIPILITIHILMGISLAGVNLASGNIGLKLAPKGEATPYLASSSLISNLAIGIGPIVGGIAANFFRLYKLSFTLNLSTPTKSLGVQTLHFQGLDFVFLFSFLIGIYSIYRLAFVAEEGEIEKKVVWKELITEMKRPLPNFSTGGGLMSSFQFPISTINKLRRKENQNKPSK